MPGDVGVPTGAAPPSDRPVSLEREAAGPPLAVREQIELRDSDSRTRISEQITTAFLSTNLVVLLLLAIMIVIDTVLVTDKIIAPEQRIVGSTVILAVIGAPTVQLGALIILMGKYIFPARDRSSKSAIEQ